MVREVHVKSRSIELEMLPKGRHLRALLILSSVTFILIIGSLNYYEDDFPFVRDSASTEIYAGRRPLQSAQVSSKRTSSEDTFDGTGTIPVNVENKVKQVSNIIVILS